MTGKGGAMTVKGLMEAGALYGQVSGDEEAMGREVSGVYCCDLLSIAMGRLPAGAVWVTVMGNINVLAVAALADAACIVLAEGARLDDVALGKAQKEGIAVFRTELAIFPAAFEIHRRLHG